MGNRRVQKEARSKFASNIPYSQAKWKEDRPTEAPVKGRTAADDLRTRAESAVRESIK